MSDGTVGEGVKSALGHENMTKDEALKHVDENWDALGDGTTVGEKLHDFFFVTPTGKNLGLPQPENKLPKAEALKLIEDSWEHPFGKALPLPPQTEEGPHKTLGEKLHDFFLVVPTGKSLGLPQAKEPMPKAEALKLIEEHWDHPFHHDHASTTPAPPASEEEAKKTIGCKIHDFFFVVPTDKNMGLPQQKKMSKDEALKKIDEAWAHPFKPLH